MLFSEFGQLLSEARIKKGLSIDNVAVRLKISARVIHALEDGNLNDLLHGTYVCSFIKTYGNFLELESDDIDHIVNSINVENIRQYMPLPTTHSYIINSNFKYYIALIVLLIIAAGGTWYMVNSNMFLFSFKPPKLLTVVEPGAPKIHSSIIVDKPPKTETLNNTQTIADLKIEQEVAKLSEDLIAKTEKITISNESKIDALKNTESENPVSATKKKPTVDDDINATEMEEYTLRDQDIIPEENHIVESAQNTSQTTPVESTPSNANEGTITSTNIIADIDRSGNDAHKIILTANAECWVYYNADETIMRQFSLQKGGTFALSFKKKLILKLGNAGGVHIRYNGKNLPPVGRVGEVKTVIFPRGQE